MKPALLAILACPSCRDGFSATAATRDGDDVIEGSLACNGCGAAYPVRNGIPRFVSTDAYVDTFSFEWTTFHDVQVDILNRTDLSEKEFRGKTGWGPEDLKGKLVLDAGVGAGRFAEIASRWGAEVVGVDLSFAVDAARDTLRDRANIHLVQADIFHLPFRPESFDAAYSMGVLHHTPDTRRAFRSVASLVKAGGEFAVFIYGRGHYSYFSDIWRKATTKVPFRLVYWLSALSVPLYYLYKIPVLGRAFLFVFPLETHPDPRWRWLNTFDWYSPQYQHKHTWAEVYRWFEECGFTEMKLLYESIELSVIHVNVRGKKINSPRRYPELAGKTVHLINIASPFREGIADMRRPPSGILYVGGCLKEHGFPVVIHHIDETRIETTVEKIISDESTLYVGFSLMTGRQVSSSALMSSRLKESRSDIVIVWGGVHPSLMPRECLDFGFIDYVIIGEGEITCLELSRYLAGEVQTAPEDIKGIAFKNGHEIVETPHRPFAEDIDEFRQDFSLIDMKKYIVDNGSERTCYFITSRGCPHSCGFCYNQKFNSRKWRGHSTQRVVDELRQLRDGFGITSVVFDDDNFFTSRRRGPEILREIKKIGITCRWVELRVDYITEEFVSELADLGVATIFMGWESGNAETLTRISKGFSPQTILEKTRILAKFESITVDASAIVGFPWETEEAIADTVSLMLKMFRVKPFKLNFNIGLYVPYPGAPVTTEAVSRGFAFPADHRGWSDYDILAGTLDLPWLTRQQIERYRLIDRYAKMLFVPLSLGAPIRIACRAMAVIAYLRIRYGIFALPLEIRLQSAALKFMLKARSRPA